MSEMESKMDKNPHQFVGILCDLVNEDISIVEAEKRILALIATDRAGLVEALKKVHIEFDAIKHTRLLSFSEMQLDKQIDSALKGEGK
jgi:hypothetical protein